MTLTDELMDKCQRQETRIKELEAKLEDVTWDYNEAMQQYDLQQRRACDAETKLATIYAAANVELDRIEKHGGMCVFAQRILAVAQIQD